MPTYKITDPQSGKNISITGDSPPSEQELNDIFSSVGSQDQSKPGLRLGDLDRKQVNQIVNAPDEQIGKLGAMGQFAVGHLKSGRRNIDQPWAEKTRKVLDVIPFMGDVLGSVSGQAIAGRPGSAVGSAGGMGTGLALSESLQELLGIQEETPGELATEATVTPLTAGAMDFALSGIIDLGFKAAKGVAGASKTFAGKTASKIIHATDANAKQFFKNTGTKLPEFQISKGLFSGAVEKSGKMIGEIQSKFDSLAKEKGVGITKNSLDKSFQSVIDKFENSVSPKAQKLGRDVAIIRDNTMDKMKVVAEIGDITNIRKDVDSYIKKFATEEEKRGAEQISRDILQDSVRQATDDSGDQTLKQMGMELNKLYSFSDIVKAQQFKGSTKMGMSLKSLMAGTGGVGVGIATGNPAIIIGSALTSVGLPMLADNPKVLEFVTERLLKSSNALKAIPESKKAEFSVGVFRRILTNLGAATINTMGKEQALPQQTPQLPSGGGRLGLNLETPTQDLTNAPGFLYR